MQPSAQKHLYESIGSSIRRIRKEKKLSQKLVGDKLSLSRTSIVNIEKGRQQILLHHLIDMLSMFNMSIVDFFRDLDVDVSNEEKEISIIEKKVNRAVKEEEEAQKLLEFLKDTINKESK